MKFTAALLHIVLTALGLLLGVFSPPGWQLPILFAAIALILVSAIAAHSYPTIEVRSRAGAAGLFFVFLLLGGPGGQINGGRGPLYFTLSLLFTFAFIGGLAIAHHTA